MAVVSLCSAKGGVGRTTLAICLADIFARQGLSVAIVDADWKQNCFSWRMVAPDNCSIDIIRCNCPKSVESTIAETARRYDLVFVDHDGIASDPNTTFSVRESDLVLIPTGTSGFDRLEVLRAYDVIERLEITLRRQIIKRVIYNQMPVISTMISKQAVDRIKSQNIPYLRSFVRRRSVFEEIHLTGETPATHHSAENARAELERVAQEIRDIFVFRSHDPNRNNAFA